MMQCALNRAKFICGILLKKKNRRKYSCYRQLKNESSLPLNKLELIQLRKVNQLLNYANKHTVYYHDVFKRIGLVESRDDVIELKKLSELQQLPVLTKEIMHKEGCKLWSDEKDELGWYSNTSGGSTGEKAIFLQDEDFGYGTTVNAWFGRRLMGVKPFWNKFLLLWAATGDIGKPTIPDTMFKAACKNGIVLNSCLMTPDEMRQILLYMKKIKFDYIRGYAESLNKLAEFAKREGLEVRPQNVVVTTATCLSDEIRQNIKDVFKCDVYDFYGSREVGPIAVECVACSGLHILMDNNYVEVVNARGKPVAPGETGELLITNLYDRAMPLIRYSIGDMAVAGDPEDICSCGCRYIKMKKLIGRTASFFKCKDGSLVDGTYLTTILNQLDKVKQFQLIQHTFDDLEFIVYSNQKIPQDELDPIEQIMQSIFGKSCNIKWTFTDSEIPPGESGKYNYILSRV